MREGKASEVERLARDLAGFRRLASAHTILQMRTPDLLKLLGIEPQPVKKPKAAPKKKGTVPKGKRGKGRAKKKAKAAKRGKSAGVGGFYLIEGVAIPKADPHNGPVINAAKALEAARKREEADPSEENREARKKASDRLGVVLEAASRRWKGKDDAFRALEADNAKRDAKRGKSAGVKRGGVYVAYRVVGLDGKEGPQVNYGAAVAKRDKDGGQIQELRPGGEWINFGPRVAPKSAGMGKAGATAKPRKAGAKKPKAKPVKAPKAPKRKSKAKKAPKAKKTPKAKSRKPKAAKK
jgi:hypothetical protein